MAKTFRDSLNERLQDPAFRTEWEALEPERQLVRAILDGKPLTGYTLEQIAEAADVSLEEARIIKKGKPQGRVVRVSKQRTRASVH